jgi:prepilin-type N-terminal cleavage/methylation domain-containing protein
VTQRGFTLLEAAVSTAITAMLAAGVVFALGGIGRFVTHQAGPNRTAATLLAEQTLRSAQDAWKYGPPGNAPAGTAGASLTLANAGSVVSVPVRLTVTLSNITANGAHVTVSVAYPPDAGRTGDDGTVSIAGDAAAKAPLPGAQVAPTGFVAAPSSAP